MTLKDLKQGMVVEFRNNRKYIVIGNSFVRYDSYNLIDNYNEDMTSAFGSTEFDIMNVWELNKYCHIKAMLEDDTNSWLENFGRLIWNRDLGDCLFKVSFEDLSKIGVNTDVIKQLYNI